MNYTYTTFILINCSSYRVYILLSDVAEELLILENFTIQMS